MMFAPSKHMKTLFSTVQRAYIPVLALILAPSLAAQQPAQKKPSTKATSGVEQPRSAIDAQQVLAVQVALDRAGFSPGEIDGQDGRKTRLAMTEFQKSANLQPSESMNEETLRALQVSPEPLVNYTITDQDVAGPFIGKMPRDMMESAKLPALGYTSPVEALGEKFHSSPALLQKLNPGATWAAGGTIKVPNVEPFELPAKVETPAAAAKPAAGAKPAQTPEKPLLELIVSGSSNSLVLRDAAGKTLMYAPVTVGSEKDPLPVGQWKVLGVSWNPVFNYNPDLFWDADPKHAKAKIPPGPNNPVGVVWIDINKEHFGLHGTPEPAAIGRSQSHGCIRLTNWDAAKLARLVTVGTKVTIQ
jgi:lipoprotein-anchoring transpeptidase ErfK/SrfK